MKKTKQQKFEELESLYEEKKNFENILANLERLTTTEEYLRLFAGGMDSVFGFSNLSVTREAEKLVAPTLINEYKKKLRSVRAKIGRTKI